MFGLGTAPSSGCTLDADGAVPGEELRRDHAGGAVRGDPLHVDVLERTLERVAQPVAHAVRVAGDLQRAEPYLAGRPSGRVLLLGGLPLDEERQLRVGLESLDADLAPAQLEAVRSVPVALHGLATEPGLDLGDVVDGNDPAQPAAAERGAGAHRLAERRLGGGRVVEHLDDL